MKKFFTLVAMAVMAMGVSAQTTWKAENQESGNYAAGTTFVDDDIVTVSTVYASKTGKAEKTISGVDFNAYFQLRVATDPTADVPTGTEQSESTPLVVTAKKDAKFTIYIRRQVGENGLNPDDNKDILLVNQNDVKTIVSGELTISEEDGDYGYCSKEYTLEAGNTYTFYRRGSTMRVFGFSYAENEATGINNAVAGQVDENAPIYNIAGQRVNKDAKGILIQNGKKFINE